VIDIRRQQRSFGDGFIHESVDELWEGWMRHADIILADEELLEIVYRALQRRHPRSGTYGRPGTPAEVVLRMLLLKHVRDWSFVTLEREVRGNLVYREFTRVGVEKVPDAKTMGRLAQALPPEVIEKVHARMVAIAQDRGVVSGKRMRVDTTVVETNIHYPTDSSLLGDGVRVLTRLMKRVTQIGGEAGTSLHDRTRSVQHRLIEIGRATRAKGIGAMEKVNTAYRKLVEATGRVVGQAKKFSAEIAQGGQACSRVSSASQARRASEGTGYCSAAREASHAPDPGSPLRRQHPHGRETGQHLRTGDRNHPQGQGQQTHRIRQDGQDSGSREPDRHCL
jgi:IS5 family transposase